MAPQHCAVQRFTNWSLMREALQDKTLLRTRAFRGALGVTVALRHTHSEACLQNLTPSRQAQVGASAPGRSQPAWTARSSGWTRPWLNQQAEESMRPLFSLLVKAENKGLKSKEHYSLAGPSCQEMSSPYYQFCYYNPCTYSQFVKLTA